MKYNFFFSFLTLLFLTGCFPSGKTVVSKHVSTVDATVPGIFYSLPKTSFYIELEAVRTQFIPGPYASWAEEFLGISGVRTNETSDWSLAGARILSYIEEDPEQTFCIIGNNSAGLKQTLENFQNQKLILLPGSSLFQPSIGHTSISLQNPPYFTELSYTDFMVEKTDTLYKTILEDSILVRIPVLRRFKETKTEEERAQEAAHYIHKLRKRRAKMVSADYPVLPQGEAMQASIHELRKIEEQYLTLFLGKEFKDTVLRSFHFTPGTDSILSKELVSFSNKVGFAEPGNGIPVTFSMEIIPSLPEGYQVDQEKLLASKKSFLLVRFPSQCVSKIKFTNSTILEYKSPLYQKGKIVATGIIR